MKARRYLTAPCEQCGGRRHLNDHPHVAQYGLDPAPAPASAIPPDPTPTVEAGAVSSPVGAARGELPAQAAEVEAVAAKRGRKKKAEEIISPQVQAELRSRQVSRARGLVKFEARMAAAALQDERWAALTPEEQNELAEAWADFSEAWGIETTGKFFATLGLTLAHVGVASAIMERIRAEGPKKETVQ